MHAACEHNRPESWCDSPHADLISIPQTTVLTSEFFDRFVDCSRLTDLYSKLEYAELVGRFLRGRFPESDRAFFRQLIGEMDDPPAIRSSSLLEDNLN